MADVQKFQEKLQDLKNKLIIPIESIQAASSLDLNIDESKLLFAVVKAQQLYLEPVIGSALLRKLQSSDLTFEYQLLVDRFLEDVLINFGTAEVLKTIGISVADGGVYRHESSDSVTASASEVGSLRQQYLHDANIFAKRMVDFLNKNQSYYPEYSEMLGDGITATKRQKFTGGLNIEISAPYRDNNIEVPKGVYAGSCDARVGPSDPSIFIAETSWGNNNETNMGFDYTTLSEQANDVPPIIIAQPVNNYFWIVSDVFMYLRQAGARIPMVEFDDNTPETEIFVNGMQDGKYWIRVKIAEVYENPVQFETEVVL